MLSFVAGVGLVLFYVLHPATLAIQILGEFLIGGGLWVTIPDYVKWWRKKEHKDDNTN